MASDVYLEHSGKKVGYMLAEDDSGLVYRPSLAPELSAQINQSNYNYGSVPPFVAVIRAWEDFHAGAGWVEGEETPDHSGHGGHRYGYSRGVDASWGGLRLSPALQALLESDATAIAAAPDFYSRTSDGVFLVAGRYVYEYVSAAWLQRADLGSGNVGTGPVVDFNGVQFVPCGDSDPYFYSADGVTWAAVTTLADLNAQFFAVRGQSSGAAVLWKITSTGALKNNTSGESGGGAWSAAAQVGGTGETVNGMIVMDGDIVVFKTDGIYTYDGTTVSKVWDGGRLMYRSNNGHHPVIWSDGNAYTTYGDTLIQFDNVNTTVGLVWPPPNRPGHPEINGQITALAADVRYIYFALKNASGNTYIMKGTPADGFHSIAYLGANDCDAMLVVGPGDLHANNPVLLVGYATAGDYFILPRSGMLPEDDSNYRFDAAGGFIVGSWDGVNAKGFPKFLNSGLVLADNLATGRTAELLYEADESGTFTSVLLADTEGKTEDTVEEEVEFNRIRYRVNLETTANTATPVVESLVLSVTPNNPKRRSWELAVKIESDQLPKGGGDSRVSASEKEKHLFDGKNERCYFYDIHGTKYRVRLLNPQGVSARRDTRSVSQVFSLSLVEI